jgi:hypothetical protein
VASHDIPDGQQRSHIDHTEEKWQRKDFPPPEPGVDKQHPQQATAVEGDLQECRRLVEVSM